MKNLKQIIGFCPEQKASVVDDAKIAQYINLKLSALGFFVATKGEDNSFLEMATPLLHNHQEKNRLLSNYLCPADQRIQNFLNGYFKDTPGPVSISLPNNTFILDRHGLARVLSLPSSRDRFISDIVRSYRIRQGILHNPKNDRRTTKNSFHIAEGGFPIPADKISVPKKTFRNLLIHALHPPQDLMNIPFTADQENQASLFVSLLLRPKVCPEVPGYMSEKSLEIRFFAPGNLVSNLDFVESIFGNGGDPYLAENDAALDAEHWTGHTGCVILAPHLVHLTKKDLGLPHHSQATETQKQNGMCWRDEKELYNDGNAFKATCRDHNGVMVTVIADNYFGYCKKEVKTQIGFSSNLYGQAEEEHAGGAIAFPSYDLGEEFHLTDNLAQNNLTFKDISRLYADLIDIKPEGYGIDKQYPEILYLPEDANFNVLQQSITWKHTGKEQKIKLLAYHTYVLPSGYKIQMQKQMDGPYWRLIGTVAEGTLCHKPSTVSGGGKSEISKSIGDAMIQGPIFTADFHQDFKIVEDIMARDFGDRFRVKYENKRESRPILSPKRSLGSVIKLFTPSATEFTDEYNAWLATIPQHIKEIIFVVKRHYQPEWGNNWKEHFTVDRINGALGHELKYNNRKLVANYLRVGKEKDGAWRIYKLRQDFQAADKLQVEDDITCSLVIPREQLTDLNPEYTNKSVKLVQNCEYRLFQRPDDCIHRGYDKQAELDLSSPNAFLSNYEPLTWHDAKTLQQDATTFDLYTEPVRKLFHDFIEAKKPTYFVSSAHPRVINEKPSKNPRYLQNRPDLVNPIKKYLAEIGTRFFRKVPMENPVHLPVNAVLPGRRNNPPDPEQGTPPLAVFNPIHYQELPELFMDFISSLTGKSPSTTGFGSEGALTKGPFNALWPTHDLNNALVSYILTGYDGFSSAAGSIGPNIKIEHDISLLIPEIWCRMSVAERDPKFLIENGYLEKLEDFEHEGKTLLASRLGYRITIRFVHAFLGRIFNNPNDVFSDDMLKPEKQAPELFVQGIESIVATQKRVAEYYFKDGSIETACPPLKALLHIMAYGHYEDKDINHPDIRAMFTRDYLLNSEWYLERLKARQVQQTALWERHAKNLDDARARMGQSEVGRKLKIQERFSMAMRELEKIKSEDYLKQLVGSLGTDPSILKKAPNPKQPVATAENL